MQPWATTFYKSQAWKSMSEYILKRDGRLCIDCLTAQTITPADLVHHITELTPENIQDASIALGEDNLVSLCRRCHAKRHGARQHRYTVDDFGRVQIE